MSIRCIVLGVPAVDDYFGRLDPASRAVFQHIHELVLDMVPDVQQGLSYGMAALRYQKKTLIAFRAEDQQLSISPFSSLVVDAVRDQLPAFDLSTGTIRFTAATPLPDEVLRQIVSRRRDEIVGPSH